MRLRAQDKLALALTSYSSVAAMSRDLGVSARTVGRWLREGRDDGVRHIPAYAENAINDIFEIHAELAREQARIDKLPFNAAAPVYTERKTLRTGEKGERALAEHTQFIRPDVRVQTMKKAAQTGKYLQASVRSRVDLKRYFRERAAEKIKERGWRMSPAELAASMLRAFIDKEAREKNRIIDKAEPLALFTQYEDISSNRRRDPLEAAQGIEDKLRKKHEPATGTGNTALADAFLFQLMPRRKQSTNAADTDTQRTKQSRASATKRRHIRGAGPK